MFFRRIKTAGLGQNSYILECGEGKAIVIDPRRDIEEYLIAACDNGLTISHVFETHRQEDFVYGTRALVNATGSRIVSGRHELFGKTDIRLRDGEEIHIGTARIKAFETPGHTPESMSYAIYLEDTGESAWGVFTGDALFIGEAGRTDLPDPKKTAENAGILYDSIHAKIIPLGDQTLLFPAHGSGSACGGNIADRDDSTLGLERAKNPAFTLSRTDFISQKENEKLPRPPYFKNMEKVNLEAGLPMPEPRTCKIFQPKEFQQEMKGGVVIDTRSPEAFAGGHVPGSYSIWMEGLSTFGGWVADETTQIFLVVGLSDHVAEGMLALSRIGLDTIGGILAEGMESWRKEGLPIERIDTTTALEASRLLETGGTHILDVRDDMEWEEEHISGALHTYVGYLDNNPPKVNKEDQLIVHCSVGHRSSLACSILKRHGFNHVTNLLGGLTAWKKLELPIEKDKAKEAA
ncbi:MAG: MBL fold metallo-hydrolase [Candidatus Binatia bacterium]